MSRKSLAHALTREGIITRVGLHTGRVGNVGEAMRRAAR